MTSLVPAVWPDPSTPRPRTPPAPRGKIPDVIKSLKGYGYIPGSFLAHLLSQAKGHADRKALVIELPDALNMARNEDLVTDWAAPRTLDKCLQELGDLRKGDALRGDAKNLSLETVEQFNIEAISVPMKANAPTLYSIVMGTLNISSIRKHKELYTDSAGVVNDIKYQELESKRSDQARIRAVTILGIILMNSNQQANLLQTCMGCYLHASHTSERVLSTLNHNGVSVSRSSTLYSVPSLSKGVAKELLDVMKKTGGYETVTGEHYHCDRAPAHSPEGVAEPSQRSRRAPTKSAMGQAEHSTTAPVSNDANGVSRDDRVKCAMIWHILGALLHNVSEFKYLGTKHGASPGEVDHLPLAKHRQYPLKAIEWDESTLVRIVGVMEGIDEQCGWVDDAGGEDNHIRLFDGDLATVERANGARVHRSTQEGVTNLRQSLEHFLMRPGFFHLKMCSAYSLFRTHLEKKDARKHDKSLFGIIRVLKPDDSNKIASKPTFRLLHEAYNQVMLATFGDCWRLEVPNGSLVEFAATRPSYADLLMIATKIYEKYVATPMKTGGYEGEDAVFHNQRFLHRDLLLYAELSDTMNAGDIGRIEDLLPFWIFMWRGTGQVKYAKEIHEFLTDLHYNYPPSVARAIRLGWLVNPTGKPGCWRGVDWVEEYNNLLIQNMCGNDSSNRTLKRIIENSNMIIVFRNIFRVFDENYGNISRTIHHSTPDMSPKINLAREFVQQQRMNEETEARGDEYGYKVPNPIQIGLTKLSHMSAGTTGDEEAEEGEVVVTGNPFRADDDMDRALNLSV